MIPMKLREIAERLNCRLEGDGDIEIRRVTGIEQAQPGDLTFIAHEKYVGKLATTRASAIIAAPAVGAMGTSAALLLTEQPYLAFAHAVGLLTSAPVPPKGIDPASSVAPDATLGPDVSIGPFVAIGAGASIGARTVIYPNVVVGPGASHRRGLHRALAGVDSGRGGDWQSCHPAGWRGHRQRGFWIRPAARRHSFEDPSASRRS